MSHGALDDEAVEGFRGGGGGVGQAANQAREMGGAGGAHPEGGEGAGGLRRGRGGGSRFPGDITCVPGAAPRPASGRGRSRASAPSLGPPPTRCETERPR